jgi:hypothetical protein
MEKKFQKKDAMNDELNGQMKVSLQENEELRDRVLLLENRLQEKETEKSIEENIELKRRVLLLEKSLQDKEAMNEKLKNDVANLIDFNNANQQRINYLLSQLEMITLNVKSLFDL